MIRSIGDLLDDVLLERERLGSPIRHLLRPPLSIYEIERRFGEAGIQGPQTVIDFYSICDGFNPEEETRFISDSRPLPLQAALVWFERLKPVLQENGFPPLLPVFGDEFGAGYGVLIQSIEDPDPPVHSLPMQCGADQQFDSFSLLFRTLAVWLRADIRRSYDVLADEDGDELATYFRIGREMNPKSGYPR